jgi:hypothetical protein
MEKIVERKLSHRFSIFYAKGKYGIEILALLSYRFQNIQNH